MKMIHIKGQKKNSVTGLPPIPKFLRPYVKKAAKVAKK